mgnify:CR=1 FL=1
MPLTLSDTMFAVTSSQNGTFSAGEWAGYAATLFLEPTTLHAPDWLNVDTIAAADGWAMIAAARFALTIPKMKHLDLVWEVGFIGSPDEREKKGLLFHLGEAFVARFKAAAPRTLHHQYGIYIIRPSRHHEHYELFNPPSHVLDIN